MFGLICRSKIPKTRNADTTAVQDDFRRHVAGSWRSWKSPDKLPAGPGHWTLASKASFPSELIRGPSLQQGLIRSPFHLSRCPHPRKWLGMTSLGMTSNGVFQALHTQDNLPDRPACPGSWQCVV